MRRIPILVWLVFLLPVLPTAAATHPRAVVPSNDAPPEVWLAQHARRLNGVERSADDSDLAPLLGIAGDARVVALGDSTHGTHEFFTLKQRIVPYLIEHAGFRTVAFEAPYEYDKLDDYVKTGHGDPIAALQISDYYFWDTQEILDLVFWIRAWNAAGNPAVSIAGIDSVHPFGATAAVVKYLQSVDSNAAFGAATRYACLEDYWTNNSYGLQTGQAVADCRAGVRAVRSEMAAHQADYAHLSSADAFDAALHAARVAEESEESFATTRFSRDSAMGENIVWLAARAKTLVLGHQAHFGRLPYTFVNPAGLEPAGAWATSTLGRDYVAIATATYTGRVTTLYASGGGRYAAAVGEIPPPKTGDVAELLSRAKIPAMIVPLHYVPTWLAGRQHWRLAGSTTTTLGDVTFPIDDNLAAGYDAILYVDSTRATTLLAMPYP